jgi:hypothetical protein
MRICVSALFCLLCYAQVFMEKCWIYSANREKNHFSAFNYIFTVNHIQIYIPFQAKKCSKANNFERFLNGFRMLQLSL